MTKKLGIPMFTKPTAGTQAANHPEGNAFYKNLVDIVTPEYDGISANGTGLVLGATNDLPIPVGYDLGSELFTADVSGAGTTTTSITDGYKLSNTGANNCNWFTFVNTAPAEDTIIHVTFNFSLTVGSTYPRINTYQTSAGAIALDTPYQIVEGENALDVSSWGGTRVAYFSITGISGDFEWDITNISAKQVTTTGYLTYETDDGVVQIDMSTGSPAIACVDSVGGEDGTEFNLGGLWSNNETCIMFKG